MLPLQLISSKLYSWLNLLIFLIVLTMRTDLQSNDSVSSIVFSFFMHSFIICFFSSLWRSLGIPCSLGGPWFMNNFVLAIFSITLLSVINYFDNITIFLVRPSVFPLLFPQSNWPASGSYWYNMEEDSWLLTGDTTFLHLHQLERRSIPPGSEKWALGSGPAFVQSTSLIKFFNLVV